MTNSGGGLCPSYLGDNCTNPAFAYYPHSITMKPRDRRLRLTRWVP